MPKILTTAIASFFFLLCVGCNKYNESEEDVSVQIVSVLQSPASQLSWVNEREMLQLNPQEKETIQNHGIKGQFEVVSIAKRGSGSKEVRVVIVQTHPLKRNSQISIPQNGYAIYIENNGVLEPLLTNSPSKLTLEIKQEKQATMFYMDYPKDRTRYGGGIFFWDENGNFHGI